MRRATFLNILYDHRRVTDFEYDEKLFGRLSGENMRAKVLARTGIAAGSVELALWCICIKKTFEVHGDTAKPSAEKKG